MQLIIGAGLQEIMEVDVHHNLNIGPLSLYLLLRSPITSSAVPKGPSIPSDVGNDSMIVCMSFDIVFSLYDDQVITIGH